MLSARLSASTPPKLVLNPQSGAHADNDSHEVSVVVVDVAIAADLRGFICCIAWRAEPAMNRAIVICFLMINISLRYLYLNLTLE